MLSNRRIRPSIALGFAIPAVTIAAIWASIVFSLHTFVQLEFLRIPFQPLSTIGIAVAFYVGFKNNASYDRFWEGRKIWGGVVNTSRSWGTAVMSYVRPGDDSPEAHALRQELIYRHLAWINAVRLQLRKKSRFFNKPARSTKLRLERHAEHMRNDWDTEISPFLSAEEHAEMKQKLNSATHLVTRQGTRLAAAKEAEHVNLFHQIALMDLLTEMYTLQGKAERIKNTPFPRQYAEYSRIFTRVFVVLVPFGLLDVFADHIDAAVSTADEVIYIVPFIAATALISWVFMTMEAIGDASEDPFERSMGDVPMNALCRTIERDLRQMLNEPEESLPPGETPIDNILY